MEEYKPKWHWDYKTEEERRHTLLMRIQAGPQEAVCFDYLLAAAGETTMTDEEVRTLKWLAGCEVSTVMNVAAVLRKAREHVFPTHVKAEPESVLSRLATAKKRYNPER